jgi:zinc transporter ZupT
MIVLPVVLSVAAFGTTLCGGLLAMKLRDRLGILTAFVAGVLIAVPLFDLLPEAIDIAESVGMPVNRILYVTGIGFLFLYILERYVSVHRVCEGGVCRNLRHPKGGWIGAVELSAHSYIDGFAIGLGFRFDARVGLLIAIAVLAHDFSDGLNTVTVMLKAGNSLRSSLRMLLLDAFAPVLGAVSALFVKVPAGYLALMLSFFAGGFLYLGAGDLLPEAHENNPPLPSVAASVAGFTVIFVVVRVLSG